MAYHYSYRIKTRAGAGSAADAASMLLFLQELNADETEALLIEDDEGNRITLSELEAIATTAQTRS